MGGRLSNASLDDDDYDDVILLDFLTRPEGASSSSLLTSDVPLSSSLMFTSFAFL